MKRWPWSLLTHALFLQLTIYIVRPTTAYRALEIGVDPALLGVVSTSFALLPLFAALFLGRASDAGHDGKLLVGGAGLMLLAGVGFLLRSPTLEFLLFWNVLLGLGHVLSVVAEQGRVARGQRSKLDSAFGLYTFAGSAGQALGPALIALVGGAASIPDTQVLFVVYILGVLCLVVSTAFMLPGARDGKPGANKTVSLRQALATPRPARLAIMGSMGVSMMVLSAIDLITVYLPALGVERAIPAATIAALLSLRAVATMASRIFIASIVRRVGRDLLIVVSTGASALLIAALVVPSNNLVLAVIVALAGTSLGIGQPLTMTAVTLAASPGTSSTWLGLRISANRLGQTTIPGAVGLFAATTGVSGAFALTALALAASQWSPWEPSAGAPPVKGMLEQCPRTEVRRRCVS
jgi:predicted MFS family arabinose efflux permease